jgi:hypothetical protein
MKFATAGIIDSSQRLAMVKWTTSMRPVTLHFLRRLALYVLLLAFLLAVVPWALRESGVIGPSVADEIAGASRTVEAARAYGASDESRPLGAAERELALARSRAAAGDNHAARRAARDARDHGIEAQRSALAERETLRRSARIVVNATDDRLNELEDLYAQATVGKDKATVASLLSLMKASREEGAGLFLAYEEGDYRHVVGDEPGVTKALRAARETLVRARDEAAVVKKAPRTPAP